MKILDATIRDGSYYVDFKFSCDDVRDIVGRLSKLGFEYIEIGHGKGLSASSAENGFSLHTDEEYMKAAAEVSGNSKIGFFCIPGIAKLADLRLAAENNVKFIRIGCNATEVYKAEDYVREAKRLGLEVMVNFMKTYAITPDEFARKSLEIEKWGADCVYVVDSSGGMLAQQIEDYYRALRSLTGLKIGFHGHNNIGLAVSNSICAIEMGYDFVDTTMQGVGRSAGNAMAEQLIMALKKKGYNLEYDIPRLLEYGFVINREIINRPSINPLDLICGYADFHSSYLNSIYRCCIDMKVDPLRLIILYSEYDKVTMDYKKLCEIAQKLPIDKEKNPYDFREFFTYCM